MGCCMVLCGKARRPMIKDSEMMLQRTKCVCVCVCVCVRACVRACVSVRVRVTRSIATKRKLK